MHFSNPFNTEDVDAINAFLNMRIMLFLFSHYVYSTLTHQTRALISAVCIHILPEVSHDRERGFNNVGSKYSWPEGVLVLYISKYSINRTKKCIEAIIIIIIDIMHRHHASSIIATPPPAPSPLSGVFLEEHYRLPE